MTTLDDYNKVLLALVIYREARGDGPEAMRAVAHVVRNRVNAHWGDYELVICKRNQFSSMSVLGDTQTIIWPVGNDIPLTIAETVYSGEDPDNTKGSLYYANEATVTSGWYLETIINGPGHPVMATIGKQTFRT
jgi:spore germination cell wall hydrolase CwlJ-like protein